MNKIHLSLVTSDGASFDGAVSYVNIPTAAGSVGVLAGHASMLCAVKRVRCSIAARTDPCRLSWLGTVLPM